MSINPLTRLYRSCEPNESLGPTDPRYVNCDEVRGENLVLLYERGLRRARPDGQEVKLFAGHRGVGKTSELLRLKSCLEQRRGDSGPFQVIYFDVDRALDVNDLDFPDLLVVTAAEVQRQLEEAKIPGFSVTTTYLKRLWDELQGLLGSEVQLSGTEVETPFGKLALELRNRPNQRARLREAIERQSTSFIAALNDLLTTARISLRAEGREGLVLLIDGLDKLVRRPIDEGTSNTHERLFIDRADQLASLKAHVVYTVPISLIYSPRCAHLEQTFGEHNRPVPMIRLHGDDRSPVSATTAGMAKVREIIEKRCAHAEVVFETTFAEGVVEYLSRMSGGHPRHLLMFVQAAINHCDTLPIPMDAAEKAVRNYANSLLREITDEAWTKLPVFDQPRDDISKDDLHQQMLYYLWVFEYMNGKPWWEVNPVLRELPKFNRAVGRS